MSSLSISICRCGHGESWHTNKTYSVNGRCGWTPLGAGEDYPVCGCPTLDHFMTAEEWDAENVLRTAYISEFLRKRGLRDF